MSDRPSRLLRLFPRAWRERYGPELLALLDERPPNGRDMLDLCLAALDARVRPRAWALEGKTQGQLLMQGAGSPVPVAPESLTTGRPSRRTASSRRFSRRVFLRNALLGGAIVASAGTGVAAVEFAWPNKTGVFGKEVVVPPAAIPPVGAPPYKYLPGKFWLINNEDGALALYWKCPHLGCTVPWNAGEGQFHCPCHQSIYDRHGVLRSGPAPRPMDLMELRVDPAGNVIVHTGRITQRDDYAPEQAVKLPTE
jgi:cytochrome b6-f complex iron-sulfur subunit